MPICKQCGEDVDELLTTKIAGKKQRVCEQCAEEAAQDEQLAQESEAVVQQMMGFQGRR